MKGHIKKNDLVLIVIILVSALLLWVIFRPNGSGEGKVAVVTVDGQEYASLPLEEDSELLIKGRDGHTNLLVIKDGQAYVAEADCSNQVCVDTGKIKEEGELIVCLPHKVVVTIENNKGR